MHVRARFRVSAVIRHLCWWAMAPTSSCCSSLFPSHFCKVPCSYKAILQLGAVFMFSELYRAGHAVRAMGIRGVLFTPHRISRDHHTALHGAGLLRWPHEDHLGAAYSSSGQSSSLGSSFDAVSCTLHTAVGDCQCLTARGSHHGSLGLYVFCSSMALEPSHACNDHSN